MTEHSASARLGILSSELLGFPPEARVLVVNADDLGTHPGINVAVIDSIRRGIVSSTSLMVPCPAAPDAMDLLRRHPEIPFGVHLTLVRDSDRLGWTPLTHKQDVPSLIDETGHLHSVSRIAEFLRRARVEEVELELRAQVDAVIDAGMAPTHLDWHCLADGGREDILDLTLALAEEYHLAARVWLEPGLRKVRRRGLPVIDHDFLDSFSLSLDGKHGRYVELLRRLPAGLNEWAVHPGPADEESRLLDGWLVRHTDHQFLTSQQAREVVDQEGIIVIDYSLVQRAWTPPPHWAIS